MTQEALKLALEALEQLVARFDCEKFTSICELEPAKDAITAIKEALAQTQEPVAWPCLIDSADFSKGTVTIVMQCDNYKVSAGTHWLSTTPPQENI